MCKCLCVHLSICVLFGLQGSQGCSVSKLQWSGEWPKEVEASERIGVSLWLRCRLALVHSLAALIPGAAEPFPGPINGCAVALFFF